MINQLKDSIRVVILDKEGFMFDVVKHTYYYIKNDSAARIIEVLTAAKEKNGGVSAVVIQAVIEALFDVDDLTAEADVTNFLTELSTKEIIEPATLEPHLPPPSIYPWLRKDYTTPLIQENPDDLPVAPVGHWIIKISFPKLLIPKGGPRR